jgi:hypothetical protein
MVMSQDVREARTARPARDSVCWDRIAEEAERSDAVDVASVDPCVIDRGTAGLECEGQHALVRAADERRLTDADDGRVGRGSRDGDASSAVLEGARARLVPYRQSLLARKQPV